MQTDRFRAWLERRDIKPSTVKTYVADAERVERYHGDLDAQYSKDRLARVIAALRYSAEDARRNTPSPSTIPINPKSLSPYKTAVTQYREYRAAAAASARA